MARPRLAVVLTIRVRGFRVCHYHFFSASLRTYFSDWMIGPLSFLQT